MVTAPVRFTQALELAERHLADLPYRQLAVEHEASGERLEPEFRRDGWTADREVVMALERPADRDVDTSVVGELTAEEALPLMRRWSAEDPRLELSEEDLRQIAEFSRRSWEARSARCLGVRDERGAPVALTALYSDGATAQVEDVYVVPEQRGHGFGRALVTRALAIARGDGHEFTFIVADDAGWPKNLYARLGFVPVGRNWLFHRDRAR